MTEGQLLSVELVQRRYPHIRSSRDYVSTDRPVSLSPFFTFAPLFDLLTKGYSLQLKKEVIRYIDRLEIL